MTTSTQALVKGLSIETLLGRRAAVEDMLSQAHALLLQVEQLATTAKLGSISNHFISYRTNRCFLHDDGVEKVMRDLDGETWRYLMAESGIRTFMDAETRRKWDEAISRKEYPAMTVDAIAGTFRKLYDDRAAMFDQGVLSCFRRLSWDYKTNQPFKFGKRIIVNYLVDKWGHPNYRNADEIDDLQRVFTLLDGKPESDHRDGTTSKIRAACNASQRQFEGDYIAVKWFKNGNGHILFKRPDLVTEMNRILAKHFPDALAAEVR